MQRAGVDSYEALHAWSAQNREAFWTLAIERLGLRFRSPFSRTMDLSPGVEEPHWLVDARLNIVESCFAAPADSPAIIHQAEGGPLATLSVGQLQALTGRVAANLRRRGFKPGDALAIIMPMTAEAVAIYLGIIQAGCVAVGIADSFQPKEIATRLRLARAVGVFTQDVLVRGGKALALAAIMGNRGDILVSCLRKTSSLCERTAKKPPCSQSLVSAGTALAPTTHRDAALICDGAPVLRGLVRRRSSPPNPYIVAQRRREVCVISEPKN